MIALDIDPGVYTLIGVVITAIVAVLGVTLTTRTAGKTSKQATAVTWAQAMYVRLVALESRVEALEGVKKHLVGFVDDFGEWVNAGATPPPPFPPVTIHNEIDMSYWKKQTEVLKDKVE
jgi:hypothetical protein